MFGAHIKNIDKTKKKSIKEIQEFKKPDCIYIPLVLGNDIDLTVIPKVGEYVYKGSLVAYSKGNFKRVIHSSISGHVKNITDKIHPNGNTVKMMIIENDFKEQLEHRNGIKEDIHKYTKEEFIEKLKENGIVGMGGAGFPTYAKYDTKEKIKVLIVNAVECEPYITADYTLLKEHINEILECIDAIAEINKIDECIIGIKGSHKELVNLVNQYAGTYLKISVGTVPDKYPMGWERALIKKVTGLDYDRLPLEKNIVVNNVSTIYSIYQTLKTGLPNMERLVTISGEYIDEPVNMLVKIGTPVLSIIEKLGYKDKDMTIVTGGPMMGHSLPNMDTCITKETNAILLLPPVDNLIETNCMHCGKCIKYCPAGLYPINIKNSINNKKKLTVLNPSACIECGLCSYICPARIPLRDFVIKGKQIVKEDK